MINFIRPLFIQCTYIALLATTAFLPASAQTLTEEERKMVEFIEDGRKEALEFLEAVVNINSGTMNLEGVRTVGRLFHKEMDALGMTTRWIPMDEAARAGHLFAETSGDQGPTILLIGHLDTVFELDSPFQTFQLDGDIARGPGVSDMKGGNVVLLYALKALKHAGVLDRSRIIVAYLGDEEDTGDPLDISRRDLIQAGKKSDIALGFEGGALEHATVARRGFTGWQLRVSGRAGHSSRIFSEQYGAGAVFELSRILHSFYDELRGEEYLTFGPGVTLGGTTVEFDATLSRGSAFGKTNVIPETALAAGDLRCISAEQLERAKQSMRGIVSRSLPGTSAEISFRDSYPPMSPTPQNHQLLSVLSQASQDLGLPEVQALDPGRRGAADVSFVAAHVTAALDGLGSIGSGAHTVEELVEIDSLRTMAQRAAIFLNRLIQGEPDFAASE